MLLSAITQLAALSLVAAQQCNFPPGGNQQSGQQPQPQQPQPPQGQQPSGGAATVSIHPNGNTGYCLDLSGNVRENGRAVQVWQCNGTPAQKWVVRKGSTAVQLEGTNFCLDAGSYPASGTRMKIWTCYPNLAAQKWNYDGSRLALEGKNQCLDLPDGGLWNGNQAQTWQCANGNKNQRWTTSGNNLRRSRQRPELAAVMERASTCKAPLTPNGRKAGLAAGLLFNDFQNYIGWWYDWTPKPMWHTGVPEAIPMLWGNGHRGGVQNDWDRFSTFKSTWTNGAVPKYMLGFNEPDCPTGESSDMSVESAVQTWNQYIAPLGHAGALLVSPAMCMQESETWLRKFSAGGLTADFDVVAVHIYTTTVEGARKVLEHYWNTYQKPMWITEFGCVDAPNGFVPCWDQNKVNAFMYDVVDLFQNHPNVYAYAPCDVGNAWKLGQSGALTATGWAYMNAIKRYV